MNLEIQKVSEMLKQSLSDEPELLIGQLSDIETWNARMQFLLAEANSHLNTETLVNLPTDGTEFSRKVALKAMTSQEEEERDKIESLCDAIKTRITLGQSFLKYYSTTHNIQYKDNTKSLKQILGE